MAIKQILLKKKIEGQIYDLYVKTNAESVVYDETSTVAEKIASVLTTLEGLTTGDASIDAKIKTATDELYEKIMGVTDASQVNEAYDTLKEVAEYLEGHGTVVQGFTDDIAALKTVVGDAESGLVKDVADLKAKENTKVEKSDTNGNIKVDGVEVQVYDDSAIAATKIVTDNEHQFVTAAEKASYEAKSTVIYSTTTPDVATIGDNDLVLVEVTPAEAEG